MANEYFNTEIRTGNKTKNDNTSFFLQIPLRTLMYVNVIVWIGGINGFSGRRKWKKRQKEKS
jgi:hypothetical protein